MKRALSTLALLLLALSAFASPLEDQKLESLSRDRSWLRLLHLSAPNTQVLSDSFYLSKLPAKKVDLFAELQTNLQQAQTNSQYRCQFPARDQWLRSHFLEKAFAAKTACAELERWKASQSIRSVSIVYPDHSLESSLGVFSHTFLKFNSAQRPLTSRLNVALSFSAQFDPKDSILKLASMGFFGGYIGKFTMTNYYTEVNRYGEDESRDIFEYELNLSKSEIDFLLDHVWEIKEADFRYYFLNGNCSYHLLTLLEIARPDLDLTSHYHFVTVPLESLKLVLAQKNMIKSQHWLPGKETRHEQLVKSLSAKAFALYKTWRNQKQVDGFLESLRRASLAPEEKAALLDLLAESPELRSQVLNLRSQLSPPHDPIEQSISTDLQNSHGAQMISLGAGSQQSSSNWTQFRYRFVLHNLLDPFEGYFKNITMEALDLRLHYTSDEQFENSSFTLINALVLKPWNEDQHFLTWQGQSRIHDFLHQPYWQNSGGLGLTKNFDGFDLYTLAIADTELDRNEKNGLGLFSGGSVGLALTIFEKYKFRANLDHLWPLQSNHDTDFWQGEVQGSFSTSSRYSLQLSLVNSWREQSALLESLTYF